MLLGKSEKVYWLSLPFLLIGCIAGMVEFAEYILGSELWNIHIWVTLAFSIVGVFIICIAGVMEHREVNK